MPAAIRRIQAAATVGLDQILAELPFTNAFYADQDRLSADVRQWLAAFLQERVAFYEVPEAVADHIVACAQAYHRQMRKALQILMQQPDDVVRQWFPCRAASHPGFASFLKYARATLRHDPREPLYGRLDMAVDRQGNVRGVYEFNGDTPVMLFESVNLQNLLVTALQGDPQRQLNDWWHHAIAYMRQQFPAGAKVAVVCDIGFIEDAATCETVLQMFEAAGLDAYLSTLHSLNHDVLSLERPFRADGVDAPLDAVFMLLPWEEMWTSGADILVHWESWYRNVFFFEPPWRWFLSHKGMLAYMTHLIDAGELDAPQGHLRTSYAPPASGSYVRKPVIGRLSHNITVVRQGETIAATQGQYGDEPVVYQDYCEADAIDGANFLACYWLVPGGALGTLAFREFDGHVLNLDNERFMPHVLA